MYRLQEIRNYAIGHTWTIKENCDRGKNDRRWCKIDNYLSYWKQRGECLLSFILYSIQYIMSGKCMPLTECLHSSPKVNMSHDVTSLLLCLQILNRCLTFIHIYTKLPSFIVSLDYLAIWQNYACAVHDIKLVKLQAHGWFTLWVRKKQRH